jgi:hypothetical protein
VDSNDFRNALIGTPIVVVLWFLFAPDVSADDSFSYIAVRAVLVALIALLVLSTLSYLVRGWREKRYARRHVRRDED